jgi:hypothetical protein
LKSTSLGGAPVTAVVRQSEGTIIDTTEFVRHREWRSVRGAVARLALLAAVGTLLYSAGVTAFAWHAASQRTLEVIEPWRHHWDLTFWIFESSAKLAWAAAAALMSVLFKPNPANMVLLLLCVLLWVVHFSIHIGLIT